MTPHYQAASKAMITRDTQGTVRDVQPTESPFVSHAGSAMLAARDYLLQQGAVLGITADQLSRFSQAAETTLQPQLGVEYRYAQQKTQFDMTTVVFEQTLYGLPVWQSGVAVHVQRMGQGQARGPYAVVGTQSARHERVLARLPDDKLIQRARRALAADGKSLAKPLGIDADTPDTHCEPASFKLLRERGMVYRYEPARRYAPDDHAPADPARTGVQGEGQWPGHLHAVLPLPPVPESILPGEYRVVIELTFSLTWRGIPDLPWVALIDVETMAVLYLRAFIDGVNGLVFDADPVTANGGPLPGATAAELDALRSSVQLVDIDPPVAGTVSLRGTQVALLDAELPPIAAPTQPAGSSFDFGARSDHFAAVNAYYHCNRFFDLVQDLGFDLAAYFTGTPFPSTVDHRGTTGPANGITINAHCVGNGLFGIGRTTFMLADLGDTVNPMGLACDWRVVLHELGGHGILYNHVNSPNFGFAHSAGDSFAAVLNDPETRAADRFQTFPWVYSVINRRHDRDVTAGWAWGGTMDVGGYSSEQVLCTTHFRLYRAVGGDSGEVAQRTYASRYTAYLMLRTIGSLTQPTNPANATAYAATMIAAERGNWLSEDMVGGVYGKVVRWAFEKQGLYQPAGTPLPIKTEGAPPAVDLYIDDGRHGEYAYLDAWWETDDIWNRHAPDGETMHQPARRCRKNHAYVRVKNRGTDVAKGGRVHAYRARPGAGLVWPDDFEPLSTVSLAVPDLAPGASVVVGPFAWSPVHDGDEHLLMSVTAPADRANNDAVTGLPAAVGPTPAWRLVPADNNIALRSMTTLPGAGGRCALEAAFCNRRFWAHNPFAKTARMALRVVLPPLLADRGWAVRFDNPGGGDFTLGPRDAREVRPVLVSGREFGADELADAGLSVLRLRVLADGIVVGGLSFRIDPSVGTPGEGCCCEPCVDDRCCPPSPCGCPGGHGDQRHDTHHDECNDPDGHHPKDDPRPCQPC